MYSNQQIRHDSCPHELVVQLFHIAYIAMNMYSRIAVFLKMPLMGVRV